MKSPARHAIVSAKRADARLPFDHEEKLFLGFMGVERAERLSRGYLCNAVAEFARPDVKPDLAVIGGEPAVLGIFEPQLIKVDPVYLRAAARFQERSNRCVGAAENRLAVAHQQRSQLK